MVVRFSHTALHHCRLPAFAGFACVVVMLAGALVVSLGQHTAMGAGLDFSYEAYASVLRDFVDNRGLVDYQGLKANRKPLDQFTAAVSRLDTQRYEGWSDKQKIAFWINVYNALTLQAIVDHYPVQASFFRSLLYPANSIRQIPGVWDKLTFSVMGRNMTLDEIEHGVLRVGFNEPRIHMALVCAAKGCPRLRNEPYVAAKLEEQLDDQVKHFLANANKYRIDHTSKTVFLSPIFNWFGDDFLKTYGTDTRFPGYAAKERAVLNFTSRYLPEAERIYLEEGGFALSYLSYDWSLNERGT